MTVRVYQKGQPYHGEAQAAYEYAYQPFLNSTIQPPITPDYGAWAARNNQLLNGVGGGWRAGRPMAPPGQTVWRGVGAMQPHPPAGAVFAPFPLGAVQIQQGSPASRHIPSAQRVMRDAYQQPHRRAPRLYGPSLSARLGDVYAW